MIIHHFLSFFQQRQKNNCSSAFNCSHKEWQAVHNKTGSETDRMRHTFMRIRRKDGDGDEERDVTSEHCYYYIHTYSLTTTININWDDKNEKSTVSPKWTPWWSWSRQTNHTTFLSISVRSAFPSSLTLVDDSHCSDKRVSTPIPFCCEFSLSLSSRDENVLHAERVNEYNNGKDVRVVIFVQVYTL